MMKNGTRLLSLFLLLVILTTGCGQMSGLLDTESSNTDEEVVSVSQNEPENPSETEVEQVDTPTEEADPQSPVATMVATEMEEPTEAPTAEPAAAEEEPAEAEILHSMLPAQSTYFGNQVITECNTGYNYSSSASYTVPKACDSWRNNLLERPLSQDLGTFFPYLDILSAQAGYNEEWYFISIRLFDAAAPNDGTPVRYFAEIDTDFNGRGDYLLAVDRAQLNPTEWSVAGLSVWKDTNKDVGGSNAVLADSSYSGDGYDTLLFDQGSGEDADLAWARLSQNNDNSVELAFKKSLLDGKKSMLWWVGAIQGEINPAKFDLVDGQDETSLFEVDTTCGWPLGVNGKGYPRQCYIPVPTPTPTQKPQPQTNVCVKPPKPTEYCNPWLWNEETCKWDCYN